MPTNNPNIPVYSADDLLRYATGRMSVNEMHALEKAALEDPFLAEAIEGYMEARDQPQLQASIDKLTPTSKEKEERTIVPLWRKKVFQYAAAATIILAGGWLTYSLLHPATNEQQTVASASEKAPVEAATQDTTFMNPPTSSSAPVNQAPVAAERDQYANAETNKAVDNAAKPKPQATDKRRNDAALISDSMVKEEAVSTNVIMDEFAKKEMKDAPFSVTPTQSAPAKNEMSSNSKIAENQNTEAYAKMKRSSDAVPRNLFRGRITDTKNNPLPYANVMITGENIGTYTDSKGNFNFTYDDSVLPVRARSLGYESQTVQLKAGNREQQIIMPEDEKLKESLSVVVQKPQAKQAGLKPLIIETDSLSSAQPVVGLLDYNTYLLNNNRISELPRASRSVELSFEVDKRGEVKNITVEQSSGKELDAEAIRLLKEGPKWKSNKGGTGRARVKVKL